MRASCSENFVKYVLLSSFLPRSNRTTLQAQVYRVFNHADWPIKWRHSHWLCSKIAYPDLSRKLENWLFLEFFFIHCKTVKVSQNDQIQMQTWFTSGSLMNGTELRSFSHFQILTWISYSDHSRNLENWLILMFAFIPCETVKVSQDDQIRI